MIDAAMTSTRDQARDETRRERFLALIGQYEAPLRRLVGAYLAHPADREDLFQEIALALWQAIPGFRGEASERTWLYRIAHNIAISACARRGRRGRHEEPMPEGFEPPAAGASSEERLVREEKRRLLLLAIRELPAVDRQVVLLHLEGLGYSEIEEVCGLSQSAIATRLTRIRDRLRDRLQGGGENVT